MKEILNQGLKRFGNKLNSCHKDYLSVFVVKMVHEVCGLFRVMVRISEEMQQIVLWIKLIQFLKAVWRSMHCSAAGE